GPPGGAAAGPGHGGWSRAAAAARDHDRGWADHVPAPHALHHAGGLPLPGAPARHDRARPAGPVPPAPARRRRPPLTRDLLLLGAVMHCRPNWTLGLAVAVVLVGGTGCTENRAESKQAQKRPPVPVAVARVEQKAMPLQIQAIGTVE